MFCLLQFFQQLDMDMGVFQGLVILQTPTVE